MELTGQNELKFNETVSARFSASDKRLSVRNSCFKSDLLGSSKITFISLYDSLETCYFSQKIKKDLFLLECLSFILTF